MKTHTYYDTVLGKLLATFDNNVVTGIYQPEQLNYPNLDRLGELTKISDHLEIKNQIDSYLKGETKEFNIPTKPDGTEFQRKVWEEITKIPYGDTITYSELAARLGNPKAVRVVATAVGRNPVTVIIPCHRIVSSGNKTVNYSGGLKNKETLLSLEQQAK